MTMKKNISIVAALWSVIILGFIGWAQLPFLNATTVLLHTIPVDPTDYLRGDYVILGYEIGDVNDAVSGSFDRDLPVYSILEIDTDGFANVKYHTQDEPAGVLYVEGEVASGWRRSDIEYGIEHYYVPRGKGRMIENMESERIHVSADITSDGRVRVRDLYIDSEIVDWDIIEKIDR